MFERFSNQARYAMVAAQEEARSLEHGYVGPEHLLLGLLHQDQGSSARALAAAGITLDAARQDIEDLLGRGERPPGAYIPFAPSAKHCLELSLREALRLRHRRIGSGHVLLGLISPDDSTAARVLGRLGADPEQLRMRVIREMEVQPEGQDDLAYGPPPPASGLRAVMLRSSAGPARLDRVEEQLTAIQERLTAIQERLTAIERHLGRPPENVVPPS